MTTNDTAAKQAKVDTFNADNLPGAWVRYWTGTRQDPAKYGQTRSKAELLSGHTPVVWVTTHGACIALTHVDPFLSQPDGIEDDSHDLPETAYAAGRVRDYITANGDGIYDVLDGHPLYARDLEALRRAGEKVDELTAEREHMELNPTGTAEWLKNRVNELTAALAEAREQIDSFSTLLGDAHDRLTESRAQAGTYANEIGSLKAELEHLREQVFAQKPVIEAAEAWAEMRETDDVTPTEARKLAGALHDAIEQHRLMDMALTSARAEPTEAATR